MTPFLPDPAKANGAAVIVAPGGGFRWLSMGNEGCEVAEALNARGTYLRRDGRGRRAEGCTSDVHGHCD